MAFKVPSFFQVRSQGSSRSYLQVSQTGQCNEENSASDTEKIMFSTTLSSFLATGDGRPLTFEQVPFEHPVYILYSSGTTGVPKCIVHCGGVGLKYAL